MAGQATTGCRVGAIGESMEIPILFGRFLVLEGKISEDELSDVTKGQSELNKSYALSALEGDVISIDDLKKVMNSLNEFKEKGTMGLE